MRKILNGAALAFLAVIFTAQLVFAYTYSASISVVESGGVSYDALPLIYDWTASDLTDNDFMEADGLDSRVLDNASVVLPHLIADDKLLFVTDLDANQTLANSFTVGNTDLADMPIIVGYDGYITTSDAAALEPGDEFELEIDGYFLAPAVTANMVTKGGGFIIEETDTGDINASFLQAEAIDQDHTPDITPEVFYGTEWLCQTFQCGVTGLMTAIGADLAETGNPSGNFVIGIYAIDGANKPTGTALGSYTMLATNVGAHATKKYTLDTPAALVSGTTYAIVMSCASGDAGNNLSWYENHNLSPNSYANGQPGFSNDSGSSWTMENNATAIDRSFETYMSVPLTITASGVSDGAHNVIIAADTSDFTITVDTVEEDSVALGGESITDNASNWIFMLNNIVSYANYIKLSVGGSLVMWYQPISIIASDTLPDREGVAQNGTITWGTNPADIDITLGSLLSANAPEPALPSTQGAGGDVLQPYDQPGWTSTSDLSGNPFYPIVEPLADLSGFSDEQVWIFFASGIVLFGMIVTFRFLPHIFAVMVVGCVLSGFFVAIGIYPFWVIFIFITGIIASLVMERTPSV